jgi:hypothetical protein
MRFAGIYLRGLKLQMKVLILVCLVPMKTVLNVVIAWRRFKGIDPRCMHNSIMLAWDPLSAALVHLCCSKNDNGGKWSMIEAMFVVMIATYSCEAHRRNQIFLVFNALVGCALVCLLMWSNCNLLLVNLKSLDCTMTIAPKDDINESIMLSALLLVSRSA